MDKYSTILVKLKKIKVYKEYYINSLDRHNSIERSN